MEEKIKQALLSYFEQKRIVFWYDDKKEFRSYFDELELPDVKKVVLENNEFAVKHLILREEPKQKFLLYQESEKPADLSNWLLDVLLANLEFHTEQSALCLADLNLGYEFSAVTEQHQEFFKAKDRREKLKKLVDSKEDTATIIKTKMLSVCVNSEADIESVLISLFSEYATGKEDKFNLIKKCNLEDFLYQMLKIKFDYRSPEPSLKDFMLKLFNVTYKIDLQDEIKDDEKLSNEAIIFMKRWKDSRTNEEAFEKISEEVAEDLEIKADLEKRDYKKLLQCDSFILVDKKIIYSLVQDVRNKTILKDECLSIIRQRKQKRWYDKPEVKNIYMALGYASAFMEICSDSNYIIENTKDGIKKYTSTWFKIDQYYRKYIHFMNESAHITMLADLTYKIEKMYSNNYLLNVNDNWQNQVDKESEWKFDIAESQNQFFDNYILPYYKKDKKVFVIISDAMRYEIGEELSKLINQEDKFGAKLNYAITNVPSYTQLGMAALLPHKKLEIKINEDIDAKNAPVFADDCDTRGLANRNNFLQKYSDGKISTTNAKDILNMKSDELKTLCRDNKVVYIYHDTIDNAGHTSENTIFKAAEETLEELKKIIKKLAGANANNFVVTADHGFIYQNRPLEDTDFLGDKPQGDILLNDVRFIIGRNLKDSPRFKKYTSKEICLDCNYEFQFPKSINRIRKKGSAGQYVHGGLSLQEVIIPVVQINKKRESDTTQVDVEIIKGSSIISSNQLAVKLYQTDKISDKLQPRTLRAGIYNKNNELISDSQEIIFDHISDNPRDRETIINIFLTKKVDEANGQDVRLKLEEQIPNTTQYKEYRSVTYTVRKTFTTDFDF